MNFYIRHKGFRPVRGRRWVDGDIVPNLLILYWYLVSLSSRPRTLSDIIEVNQNKTPSAL